MATFGERVIGAARLNTAIYEEVENDKGATGQAAGVVVVASIAAGLGGHPSVSGLVFGVIAGLVAWVIWSYLTWFIGTKWLPEAGTHADLGQLMRTVGFAQAPGVLQILGIIPFLGGLIMLAVAIWVLVAVVIAVRQALDYTSTGRAVGVCVIGWLIQIAIFAILFMFARSAM
jgi:hypothetical protein